MPLHEVQCRTIARKIYAHVKLTCESALRCTVLAALMAPTFSPFFSSFFFFFFPFSFHLFGAHISAFSSGDWESAHWQAQRHIADNSKALVPAVRADACRELLRELHYYRTARPEVRTIHHPQYLQFSNVRLLSFFASKDYITPMSCLLPVLLILARAHVPS